MNKQRIIIIVSFLIVLGGVVSAYIYYQDSSKPPMFRTQENSAKNESASASDEKCIITVRGDKYDVTEFRNKHKGGNIFNCDQDMTEAFNKQHGEKQLRDLQKYKVTN